MNGQYASGEVVLGNWTLTRLIGEGSFGRVFEAEREDFGRVYKAAIKIITIPHSRSEIDSIMADGLDRKSVTAYYKGLVGELVDEFSLMASLKGNSNVVSYEDHAVVPHSDNIGWDIIIRMELLTPLIIYTGRNQLTRNTVTQLGIDICKALELCQRINVIHRDIKPENIFVSDMGDFKLGDFGIARTAEKTTNGLSKKGTSIYMAPEIYRGEAYGSSVDIYSLGIVLYRLLNGNRVPFMPDYPAPISHSDRERALAMRISGADIPPPKNADGRLAEIVLKACAYRSKERYSSPMQMREELEAILYNRAEAPIIYPKGDETPVMPVIYEDGAHAVGRAAVSPGVEASIPAVPEHIDGRAGVNAPRPGQPARDATERLFADEPRPEAAFGASGAANSTQAAFRTVGAVANFAAPAAGQYQAPLAYRNHKKIPPAAVFIPLAVIAVVAVAVALLIFANNGRGNTRNAPAGADNSGVRATQSNAPADADSGGVLAPQSSAPVEIDSVGSNRTEATYDNDSIASSPPLEAPADVTSVTITYSSRPQTDFTINIGERVPLRARLEPADAEAFIEWESSDTDVFQVVPQDTEGKSAMVTAIGRGTAELIVTAGEVETACTIRVR